MPRGDRRVAPAEIDATLREEPSDDLALPRGLLLMAWEQGVAVGCAGLRLRTGGVGEVTRVFVAPAAPSAVSAPN